MNEENFSFVENLDHTVETKTITIERLSKGGYVVVGTPKLNHSELNELLDVLYHELKQRGN